jgi:hypothetical protein
MRWVGSPLQCLADTRKTQAYMVAIIETRHRTHPRLQKQPRFLNRGLAKMVRPTAALAASHVLTHVLLNRGETRCHVQRAADRGTLRSARALLRQGGVQLSRSCGSYATLHYGRGGLILTLGIDSLPLTISALALDPSGTGLWEWLMISHRFFRASIPGYRTGPAPEKPGTTPWLATLDSPHAAAHVSPQMAGQLRRFAGELGVALAFSGAGK